MAPNAELENSMFAASTLGVIPRCLPSILGNNELSALVKLNLSEKILIDASEFINAVYEDMSQINEILTLKDQTLLIEGACLFFKGHTLVNSLKSPTYLTPLLAIANIHDLFEKTSS